MLAFHNDANLKQQALEKLKLWSQGSDVLQHYFHHLQEGKSSAIGCLTQSNEIEEIAEQYGIPLQLAGMQHHIYHNAKLEYAVTFAHKFFESIPVGVDLDPIWKKYFLWVLVEDEYCLLSRLEHIDLAKHCIEKAANTIRTSLSEDIPEQKLEGIILDLQMTVRNIGYAADAGEIEPPLAGFLVARAQWAVSALLRPQFAKLVLPETGSQKLWEWLGEYLLELVKKA
ncbi:MAG: hypothetical protein AAF518_11235 [Spirochaetota bacterium]